MPRQRRLESLRRALEGAVDRRREAASPPWPCLISSIACAKRDAGRRSKEIVTDGSWPRCVIASGPIVGLQRAPRQFSGTSAPLSERT